MVSPQNEIAFLKGLNIYIYFQFCLLDFTVVTSPPPPSSSGTIYKKAGYKKVEWHFFFFSWTFESPLLVLLL